jgi:hypothetical protein
MAKQSTPNIYVGTERYAKILDLAINVSNDTRIQVTPSQFVQHLVDNYSDIARKNWISTTQKDNKKV